MELCFEKTLDMPFLAYYGCSKLLKARAVFYWVTHPRFTVSVGIDLRHAVLEVPIVYAWTREPRISALWEIVYYLDTWIVYLAVCETEYFTEILRNITRMREQWCPGRFSLPRKKRPGNEAICMLHIRICACVRYDHVCARSMDQL